VAVVQQTMPHPTGPASPPRGRIWVKLLLVVLCLLTAGMWVYYFFFASDKGIYQLDDKNWRVQAKPVCVAAYNDMLALTNTTGGFITNPTADQMRQRADIVDRATDVVEKMLDDIVAIPVATDRDRQLLQVFADNYRLIIKDRRRYAASLRAGHLVKYSETLVAGGPVSNVVLDFTAGVKGNDVPDCSPPSELGGDVKP
jgi:hypothetical protein